MALVNKRVRLLEHDFDPRFAGLTGVLRRDLGEDSADYFIEMDRPLPPCALEYEDTRTGRFAVDDLSEVERISSASPAHAGVGDGPNPLMTGMLQSISDALGPDVGSIEWADDDGTVTGSVALPPSTTRRGSRRRTSRPDDFEAAFRAYLAGERPEPRRARYGLSYTAAERIREQHRAATREVTPQTGTLHEAPRAEDRIETVEDDTDARLPSSLTERDVEILAGLSPQARRLLETVLEGAYDSIKENYADGSGSPSPMQSLCSQMQRLV